MVELVNGSTSWQSLIAYQCKAGYYEAREGRQDNRQDQLHYLANLTQAVLNSSPYQYQSARQMETGVQCT